MLNSEFCKAVWQSAVMVQVCLTTAARLLPKVVHHIMLSCALKYNKLLNCSLI